MFSDPIVLYSGPWPDTDSVLITPTLAGHHKFIVFGTGTDGTPTYDGCETEGNDPGTGTTAGSTAGTTSGSAAVGGVTATPAKTGANIGSTSFIAGALVVIGAFLLLAFGRRRQEEASAAA